MKTCKKEGCDRAMHARGMCDGHYSAWMQKMRRRGLDVARATIAEQMEDVLPATRRQMVERLGVTMRAVQKTVPELHKARKIHILRYDPPIERGKWTAVFAWGPGEDADPDYERRRAHRAECKRRNKRDWRARNSTKPPKPTNFAALLAPLHAT